MDDRLVNADANDTNVFELISRMCDPYRILSFGDKETVRLTLEYCASVLTSPTLMLSDTWEHERHLRAVTVESSMRWLKQQYTQTMEEFLTSRLAQSTPWCVFCTLKTPLPPAFQQHDPRLSDPSASQFIGPVKLPLRIQKRRTLDSPRHSGSVSTAVSNVIQTCLNSFTGIFRFISSSAQLILAHAPCSTSRRSGTKQEH
eukprot:Gregarina_sp_Poly_1__9451@NODE_592_length_7334_cov_17_757259_g457_i0_p3_GENE_NODE_592_length_7334_cov_17_757259_g457_i0NODE_592_length_7334_cov_17_757259_g457_i0_p3_ORF_typecomplete_len201_score14_73_NODE_592_length_7334_cov_17_757259_g457_i066027204